MCMPLHFEDPPMYQPPEKVTIVSPMPTTRARGINATGELYGRNIRVRISLPDRQLLEEVTEVMNMSIGAFVRWSAVRVAEQIKQDIERKASGS